MYTLTVAVMVLTLAAAVAIILLIKDALMWVFRTSIDCCVVYHDYRRGRLAYTAVPVDDTPSRPSPPPSPRFGNNLPASQASIKVAALAIVVVVCLCGLSIAEAATTKCPVGPAGDVCRVQCSTQCHGHTDCDVDDCGLLSCECSGFGKIDYDTGLCRCDVGHSSTNAGEAVTNCAYVVPVLDCRQGQPLGLFLPPVTYQTCNASTLVVCQNGAIAYSSNSLNAPLQPVVQCNPPHVGPFALSMDFGLGGVRHRIYRGAQFEFALRQPTAPPDSLESTQYWFTFVRESLTLPIYTIHSSMDMNRTLEIVQSGGNRVVRLSANHRSSQTLWRMTDPLLVHQAFQITSNDDQTQFLGRSGSDLALVDSSLAVTSNTYWLLQAPVAEIDTIQSDFSIMGAGVVLQRSVFFVPTMAACVSQCRRDGNCRHVQWMQTAGGACYFITTPGVTSIVGGSHYTRLFSKPYVADAYRSATRCLLPPAMPGCETPRLGPVHIQSSRDATFQQTAKVLSVYLKQSDIRLFWSDRGGAISTLAPDGSRNWDFVNVDNGNEWVIFPQDSEQYVLGVGSGNLVQLLDYNPQSPFTWIMSGNPAQLIGPSANISNSGSFYLSPSQIGYYLVTASSYSNTPTVVSGLTAANTQFVSQYRLTWGDNDPVVHALSQSTSGTLGTYGPASSFHACFGRCQQEPTCRMYFWSQTTLACYQYRWDLDGTRPKLALTGALYGGFKSRGADNLVWNDVGGSCTTGTLDASTLSAPIQPTMFAWRYFPSAGRLQAIQNTLWGRCITPQSQVFYLRPTGIPETTVSKSDGSFLRVDSDRRAVAYGGLLTTGDIAVEFGEQMLFRYTGDADGVMEIYSSSSGYKTLEIERSDVPARYGPPVARVVFKDVRPRQPARWRLDAWPLNTRIIESFDDPGRYLVISGDPFNLPSTLGVSNQARRSDFAGTANAWNVDFTERISRATVCAIPGASVLTVFNTLTVHDEAACEGYCHYYRRCNWIKFDSFDRQCILYEVTEPAPVLNVGTSTSICSHMIFGFRFTQRQIEPCSSDTTIFANYAGCNMPLIIPDAQLQVSGTNPDVSNSFAGQSVNIKYWYLIASGFGPNSYLICGAPLRVSVESFGGTLRVLSIEGQQPTLCMGYVNQSSVVQYVSVSGSNNVVQPWLIQGLALQTIDDSMTWSGLTIRPDYPESQFLDSGFPSSPDLFLRPFNPTNPRWDIILAARTRTHSSLKVRRHVGSYIPRLLKGQLPQFVSDRSGTRTPLGSGDDYLRQELKTNNLMRCTGLVLMDASADGFIWLPPDTDGFDTGTCLTYSNFVYSLNRLTDVMSNANGLVSWSRGSIKQKLTTMASSGLVRMINAFDNTIPLAVVGTGGGACTHLPMDGINFVAPDDELIAGTSPSVSDGLYQLFFTQNTIEPWVQTSYGYFFGYRWETSVSMCSVDGPYHDRTVVKTAVVEPCGGIGYDQDSSTFCSWKSKGNAIFQVHVLGGGYPNPNVDEGIWVTLTVAPRPGPFTASGFDQSDRMQRGFLCTVPSPVTGGFAVYRSDGVADGVSPTTGIATVLLADDALGLSAKDLPDQTMWGISTRCIWRLHETPISA